MLAGSDDRGEGRDRQIERCTPESVVSSGADVPSAYVGDWQLLYMLLTGRKEYMDKKKGFQRKVAFTEVAERTGSCLSFQCAGRVCSKGLVEAKLCHENRI